MKLSFTMITLVYSRPKYVSPTVELICCGQKIHKLDCHKYGKIHVGCNDCGAQGTLDLTRQVVRDFHMKFYPQVGGLDYFLDRWQEDMVK